MLNELYLLTMKMSLRLAMKKEKLNDPAELIIQFMVLHLIQLALEIRTFFVSLIGVKPFHFIRLVVKVLEKVNERLVSIHLI